MALLFIALCGCEGVSLSKQTITIKMLGTFEEPSVTPAGGFDPISQTYKLTGVSLTNADGSTEDLLADAPEQNKFFRIINRTQIIFSKEVSTAQIGQTYSSLNVTFDPAVTAISKYNANQGFVLEPATFAYDTSVSIEKGKSLIFTVKVKWKNTVTRDDTVDPPTETMEVPELVVSADGV